MKRDKTMQLIAKAIVWLEDLRLEINARRFIIESKRAHDKHLKPTVDIVHTKIIDRQGTVVCTFKDVQPKP